jgi:UDP-N-acetylmuramate dehydrogenase
MPDISPEKSKLKIQENVPLAPLTTFKIGGPAKMYVEVHNKQDLQQVLSSIVGADLHYIILGGGSNVLISDDGFDGLVIHLMEGDTKIDGNQATVFAGNNWSDFIKAVVKANLEGLEPCANIPGTVGGAIRGNAGAYGVATCDFIKQVEVLVIDDKEVSLKVMSRDDCEFEYRESIFKQELGWVIAEAVFEFKPATRSPEERLKEIESEYQKRQAKQPLKYPSAGCSFKNIIYTDELEQYKDWQVKGKIPAARFIDEAGLKGMKIGGAMVSKEHANFIINFNQATADDVIQLLSLIKMRVRDRYKVQLQEEVHYVGFH